MFRRELISEDNLETAIRVQEELFPDCSGRVNLEEAVFGVKDYIYWLLYLDEECIGISGLYHYPDDWENAWLGWFGIREAYRKNHYGSVALRLFEEEAKDRGYRYARVYTDALDNDVAISFYRANGYVSEEYHNEDDPMSLIDPTLIFSKSLYDEELPLWNNRNLDLTAQSVKEEQGKNDPDLIIRKIREDEYDLLDDFLYEAIYIPKGVSAPPRDIIDKEELQAYVHHFGKKKDDHCLVAELKGKVIGAVWSRIMNDYGHLDDKTPSLAISLYKEYRGRGIGTRLLQSFLAYLRDKGYQAVSLSVQKDNYALKMYLNCGFAIIRETEEEYLLLKQLRREE